MKKTILQTLSFILFTSIVIQAQDFEVKWTEKMKYDNKKDGFFNRFIDANSKYIYGEYTAVNFRDKPNTKSPEKKLKIVAYDKITLSKIAEVNIRGFKENKPDKKKYKGLTYERTLIFENVIYVFWRKESDMKEELFIESFDASLKRIAALKKIYELGNQDSREARSEQSLLILGNKKAGEKVVIGGELPAGANKNVKFEYKLLNTDLTFATANQIELPIKLTDVNYGLTSNYEYGDDGRLYIKSYVSMSKDENKFAQKGEATVYPILSTVDLMSGKITPFVLKFDNKNVLNFNYTITQKGIKIYGFFSDLTKASNGYDIHGLFYSILESKATTMPLINFTYFDNTIIDKMYGKEKEVPISTYGDKAVASFLIEDVHEDGDNLILFCSKMANWSLSGNYSVFYYCTKKDITILKINREGKLVWTSNIERSSSYSGRNQLDVKVIRKEKKYYVLFGSMKNKDSFEYAVIDDATGGVKKTDFILNAKDLIKQGANRINVQKIRVVNNSFFVDSQTIKLKPVFLLVTILCWPAGLTYYLASDKNIKSGKGNIGVIRPLN